MGRVSSVPPAQLESGQQSRGHIIANPPPHNILFAMPPRIAGGANRAAGSSGQVFHCWREREVSRLIFAPLVLSGNSVVWAVIEFAEYTDCSLNTTRMLL